MPLFWCELEPRNHSRRDILWQWKQSRIKGGNGANAPGPHCKGASCEKIYLFQIKYSFENFHDSEAILEYNSVLYSYVALSIKDPQQQLNSLQVWLSTSFSNRYWIAYKYFRFCSRQMYFMSLVTFPNNLSFGMGIGYDSLLVHHVYCTNVTKTLLFAC